MKTKNIGKSAVALEMPNESPLRVAADPRFYMLIIRAIRRARVVPAPPTSLNKSIRSERSSWSSASIVSSTYLKSPEPIFNQQSSEKLVTVKDNSRRRRLIIGFAILAIVVLFIGIALSITLPLILNKTTTTATPTSFMSTEAGS